MWHVISSHMMSHTHVTSYVKISHISCLTDTMQPHRIANNIFYIILYLTPTFTLPVAKCLSIECLTIYHCQNGFGQEKHFLKGRSKLKNNNIQTYVKCIVDAKHRTVTYNTWHVTVFRNIGGQKHFPSCRTHYYFCKNGCVGVFRPSELSVDDASEAIYLHLLSQGAAESMDVVVGWSTCWHASEVLLSPQHSAGTVPPQSAHTEEKHQKTTNLDAVWC